MFMFVWLMMVSGLWGFVLSRWDGRRERVGQGSPVLVSGESGHITRLLLISSDSPAPSPSPANHRYQGYDALNIKESWSGICPSRFPLNIYFFIEKRLKTVSMTWWHHVEVKGPAATTIQGTRLIIRLRIISIMYYCSMCIYSSFYTNISSSFDF